MNYPLIQYEEYDTTLGDVDASGLFAATIKNQTVVLSNTGTGGNQITGVPAGSAIEDGKTEVYYRTQTGWRIKVSSGSGGAGILTAGDGLTGGGDMTGNVTVDVVGGSGITANADDIEITPEGVDASMLAGGAVTTPKIASGAVNSDKIGGGAVTEGKIAGGAVTTAKIGDSQVTEAKLAFSILDIVYPVGASYIQLPGATTPTLLFPGTTWKAEFETEGVAFRTPGGQALAFNGGIQEDAVQQITGGIDTRNVTNPRGIGRSVDAFGALSLDGPTNNDFASGGQGGYGVELRFDNNLSKSPNPAKTDPVETRMRNRTFRVWIRIA